MPKTETPKIELEQVGWESWTAFYEQLEKDGLAQEETVDLTWPDCDVEKLNISLDRVKSGAFSELYPKLPQKGSVEVIIDIVKDAPNMECRQLVIDFLNKIPTQNA